MRTNSLKNSVLAVACVMAARVSAVPSLTPIFSTTTSDGAVESMPMIIPSGIPGGPGPVITSGTGTDTSADTNTQTGTNTATSSGSVSISTLSTTNSTRTASGTGTTAAPSSTSSTSAGLPAYASPNLLVAGLFVLSASGVHLL